MVDTMQRHTMKEKYGALALLLPLAFAACDNSPTGPEEYATEELTAQLVISPDHFHIWETTGAFTVAVTDPDGRPVTDFEEIRLERQRQGATNWGSITLTRDGDFYRGTYTFEASGNYNLRIAGKRAADEALKVLLTVTEPLEVVRAHATVGNHRVEFEAFPGHIHAGDSSVLTFWIASAGTGHDGADHAQDDVGMHLAVRNIFVTVGGSTTTLSVTESEPGRFTANHQFTAVGPAVVGIRFSDHGEFEWSVPITVHAAH